jgi:hypothetical protein
VEESAHRGGFADCELADEGSIKRQMEEAGFYILSWGGRADVLPVKKRWSLRIVTE